MSDGRPQGPAVAMESSVPHPQKVLFPDTVPCTNDDSTSAAVNGYRRGESTKSDQNLRFFKINISKYKISPY